MLSKRDKIEACQWRVGRRRVELRCAGLSLLTRCFLCLLAPLRKFLTGGSGFAADAWAGGDLRGRLRA